MGCLRHGKGTWDDSNARSLKNQWLQHLVLAGPERETPGIRLQAVDGLAGVKSLDPDSFMGLAAEASASAHAVRAILWLSGTVKPSPASAKKSVQFN